MEKSLHPEHRNKPLVVSGDPERRSGIILAACPLAKSYGITTAERLGEALAKCPQVVVMKPSMQRYIDFSLRITAIYEQYSDLVEPYSIDEQFIDVSGSLKLFGNPYEIGKQIQDKVMQEIGVRVRVGIGENKILAKTACDNFAKKNESGIYELKIGNLNSTLWPPSIDKMFMIGGRMTQHCVMMGIRTIGDLAQLPLGQVKQMMRSRFGRNSDIQAELLWRIANGIDDSPVSPNTHNQAQKGIGHMMTLPRDYYIGQTSIFRASSATDAGQVKNRSMMIGGHLK